MKLIFNSQPILFGFVLLAFFVQHPAHAIFPGLCKANDFWTEETEKQFQNKQYLYKCTLANDNTVSRIMKVIWALNIHIQIDDQIITADGKNHPLEFSWFENQFNGLVQKYYSFKNSQDRDLQFQSNCNVSNSKDESQQTMTITVKYGMRLSENQLFVGFGKKYVWTNDSKKITITPHQGALETESLGVERCSFIEEQELKIQSENTHPIERLDPLTSHIVHTNFLNRAKSLDVSENIKSKLIFKFCKRFENESGEINFCPLIEEERYVEIDDSLKKSLGDEVRIRFLNNDQDRTDPFHSVEKDKIRFYTVDSYLPGTHLANLFYNFPNSPLFVKNEVLIYFKNEPKIQPAIWGSPFTNNSIVPSHLSRFATEGTQFTLPEGSAVLNSLVRNSKGNVKEYFGELNESLLPPATRLRLNTTDLIKNGFSGGHSNWAWYKTLLLYFNDPAQHRTPYSPSITEEQMVFLNDNGTERQIRLANYRYKIIKNSDKTEDKVKILATVKPSKTIFLEPNSTSNILFLDNLIRQKIKEGIETDGMTSYEIRINDEISKLNYRISRLSSDEEKLPARFNHKMNEALKPDLAAHQKREKLILGNISTLSEELELILSETRTLEWLTTHPRPNQDTGEGYKLKTKQDELISRRNSLAEEIEYEKKGLKIYQTRIKTLRDSTQSWFKMSEETEKLRLNKEIKSLQDELQRLKNAKEGGDSCFSTPIPILRRLRQDPKTSNWLTVETQGQAKMSIVYCGKYKSADGFLSEFNFETWYPELSKF